MFGSRFGNRLVTPAHVSILVMGLFVLLGACQAIEEAGDPGPQTFSAVMVPEEVFVEDGEPAEVDSDASASANATLEGNVLTVVGRYNNLSSDLRDIDENVFDPGVHIHPGAAGETNGYIYALVIQPDEVDNGEVIGDSGNFFGQFTLTEQEVALLTAGNLYLDIHTVDFEDGEVRGQLEPDTAVDAAEVAARFGAFDPDAASHGHHH